MSPSRQRRAVAHALVVLSLLVVPTAVVVAETTAPVATASTVVILRHADRAPGEPTDQTPLNEDGRRRAETLSGVLADARVAAIYATPTRRTHETAEPLAKALGLEVVDVGLGDGYAVEQAKRLRERPPGDVAVVVSHSNKVPAVLAALGVSAPPAIAEPCFDDLFVVTLPAEGPPTLVHLHYGEPCRR